MTMLKCPRCGKRRRLFICPKCDYELEILPTTVSHPAGLYLRCPECKKKYHAPNHIDGVPIYGYGKLEECK